MKEPEINTGSRRSCFPEIWKESVNLASVTFGSMGMKQIAGEIFAENGITRELCLRCLVMDQAGDVLADAINEAYGDALVTSLILPELFFNGFPFVFEIYYGGARRPAHIRIIPEEEY